MLQWLEGLLSLLQSHWEILSALATAGFALYKYMDEGKKNRAQRVDELEQSRVELRWRQAQAAKQIIDEMMDDKEAKSALEMLDSESREFEISPGVRKVINVSQWLTILKQTNSLDNAQSPDVLFVRDGFDGLFYYMALLEHYIDLNFVRFEDISFPVSYYVEILAEDKDIHLNYMTTFGFHRAIKFIQRFSDWQDAAHHG